MCLFLSAFPEKTTEWVYRIFDRRTISIKAKNEQVHKIAVVDLQTNLPFGIEVPADFSLDGIEIGKAYYASLKVYASRDIVGVPPDMVDFFKGLDVDQSIEDFIKAYWLYPKLIKFELVEAELL